MPREDDNEPSMADSELPMDWRIKGTIQKVLGYVPGGTRLHLLLQQRFGGLSRFEQECDVRVTDWTLMMRNLQKVRVPVEGAILLEIGSGWYPALPVCLGLAGAARVHTYDLVRHYDVRLTRALIERLARVHAAKVADSAGRDREEVARRLAEYANLLAAGVELGQATGGVVDYHAPGDASDTGLPDASVDVVFSNNVLEHIPAPVLEACFREAYRILKPGGIVYHSVNCGDHYAYSDPEIDQVNYLQYSEAAWRRWDNEFLYQNRLRAFAFTDMARDAGFAIALDIPNTTEDRLHSVRRMRAEDRLDPAFRDLPDEQLAITSLDFVGRKLA